MAYTPPVIHSVGDVLTASDWNTSSNDIAFLYGDAAWTAPTLAGTWVNFGGATEPAGYRAWGSNVQIRGLIKSGTINTTAFTLPAGYRPVYQIILGTMSAGAFAQLTINTSGTVVPSIGSTVSFQLDCFFSLLA